MNVMSAEMEAHLAGGHTTLCRAWALTRRDGVRFGFTDHDCDLHFDGITFRADSGLSASAFEQSTGLAVDNTEALGVLNATTLREEDIIAGRFDGAEVLAWLVNWAAPEMRILQFRGSFGEITRAGPAFRAELRGLSEALGQVQGRIYQKTCAAVLGDGRCRFDLDRPGYAVDLAVARIRDGDVLEFAPQGGFAAGWFARGRIEVLSGAAAGLVGVIKSDRDHGGHREITLWQSLRAGLRPGDRVRLQAGCDKRAQTCRLKFNNFINFQGFPTLPGDDWLMAVPRQSGTNDGGRLR